MIVTFLAAACSESASEVDTTHPTRLRVEAVGWGNAKDGNGFSVTVAGRIQPLSWDGAATFDNLETATVVASLGGVAAHCEADSTSRTRVITQGRTDTVRFAVGCFGDLIYHDWLGHSQVRIHYFDTLGIDHQLGGSIGRQIARQWAPDGERILIGSNERGDLDPLNYDAYDIGVINRSGGATTWIGRSDVGEFWPQWSSDGQRIVYNRRFGHGGWIDSTTIRIAHADGTNDRQLVFPTGIDLDPVWVRGDSAIAYGCFGHPGPGLCRADGAGGVTAMDIRDLVVAHLNASPDGEWIAYEASTDRQEFMIIPARGGTPRRIDPNRSSFWAEWSPGSDKLLYTTVEQVSPEYTYGARIYDRTTGTVSENLIPFTTNYGGFSWSADGGWLAILPVIDGRPWIHVMRADGAGMRKLPAMGSGLGLLTTPFWRRKSRFVPPPSWVHLPAPAPADLMARAGGATLLPPNKCGRQVGPRMAVVDCSARN
jgi:hypothetical protein